MSKQSKTILIVSSIVLLLTLLTSACSSNLPRNGGGDNNSSGLNSSIDAADHLIGRLDAPVKMIVYSDFECPFCADFSQTMKQVEKEFTDKLVIAFRHYPLAGHRQAKKAAEASECAAEQGKFWEMHDKLFADNVAGRLSAEQSKKDAAELGLDQAKFNQCLNSGRYESKVSQQKAQGDNAGVTGTPTSFLNGYVYPGAYPFEDFTAPDGKSEKGMKNIISELLK